MSSFSFIRDMLLINARLVLFLVVCAGSFIVSVMSLGFAFELSVLSLPVYVVSVFIVCGAHICGLIFGLSQLEKNVKGDNFGL